MRAMRLTLCAAAMGAAAASADTDVYGNEIRKDDTGEVSYQFWYGGETAEAMSPVGSVSADSIFGDVFEPRYLTSAVSNGDCRLRGLCIVVR